jgi:argininosuccinate synthase
MKISDLKGKKVAALVSGGLDSTTIISWASEQGAKVTALIVDIAQPDEVNMNDIDRRMRAAGAEDAVLIDGRELLAEYGLLLVHGQGAYEGGYLNTTGIARMAIVKAALPEIKKRGIKIVMHGATGRGNDQVRFELGFAYLAPDIKVYAPWRDRVFQKKFGGRKEMIRYCQRRGLKVSATIKKPYSTDSNFLGLTHEAGILEDLSTPTSAVDFLMGNYGENAPEAGEKITIYFKEGWPIFHDFFDPLSVFLELNKVGGRNGIGIGIDVVENRRVGIKSRGVYESPGLSILFAAYEKMLQLILDRGSRRAFDSDARRFGEIIYRGEFYSQECKYLLPSIKEVAKDVNGSVSFLLCRGRMKLLKASSPKQLYNADRASMEKVGDFDHTDSQGYLNIASGLAKTQSLAGLCGKY